jgi:hypothetical protein
MHRKNAPLTSGRTILWRTIPFLFVAPLVSTFVPGHDLVIYLSCLYAFLLILLYQYRQLCYEWSVSTWTAKVPVIKTEEVTNWYKEEKLSNSEGEKSELTGDALDKAAAVAFQAAVEGFSQGQMINRNKLQDCLVAKASHGLPFALWLLEKESPSPAKKSIKDIKKDSEMFSKIWLAKVEQALKNTQQLAQGLKEHSVFVLFRHGKYDVSTFSYG